MDTLLEGKDIRILHLVFWLAVYCYLGGMVKFYHYQFLDLYEIPSIKKTKNKNKADQNVRHTKRSTRSYH